VTDPVPGVGMTRPPDTEGVIHDIGYRHYAGERLDRWYIARSLFTSSLRGAFGLGRSGRSKVLPMLLAGAMVGTAVVIVVVINVIGLDEQPLAYSRFAIALQLVIAIFLASQAPQLVSRDLRFRTISLYFARPLERIDYVTAKYAAMAAALFIITGLPLVVLYLGGLLAGLKFGRQTAEFAGGMLGLIILSLLLAGVGLVFAALTPRRGFAVAIIMVVVFLSYGAVNIVAAVASETGNSGLAGWVGLFSPMTLFDGAQVWLFEADSSAAVPPPGTIGGIVYSLVALGCIVGSFGILIVRYRRLAAA
jgi:ABC-2 type transport system permease protein